DDIVETLINGGLKQVTHPSYQAWSYASTIQDYNQSFRNQNIGLHPFAFLHNYRIIENDPLIDKLISPSVLKAPLFGKNDVDKLSKTILNLIKKGDNKLITHIIENGVIKPSKALQDAVRSMIEGNPEFIMLDEQKEVYEQAKLLALQSMQDNRKRVLIVDGGPGTGKTVLAINLMTEMIKQDISAFYVTKNAAPRQVFKKKLKGLKKVNVNVNDLFMSSGSFCDEKTNRYDVLIVDEAHRLNEKSGMFANLGENQIKEIINSAKFSIFFIDDYQRVTDKDIGSIKELIRWASFLNTEIHQAKLVSQFRCNGSDGYLAWLDNTLQIRDTANLNFEFDYDFRVFDDPNELLETIKTKNSNNKARVIAGYCWEWPKVGQTDPDQHDIKIPEYNFSMSWNLNQSGYIFALDEQSIDQAGCIHTTQGLEFDYVGIITGPDLSYDPIQDKIITDMSKRAKSDQSIKSIRSKKDIESIRLADEIIKNTYRTLMTRGQKGCYIFCADGNLSKHIKLRIMKQ
ncbi:MAG: DUF2075 domain-containing protein, partial [Erysipelotrichaceae bacterium]